MDRQNKVNYSISEIDYNCFYNRKYLSQTKKDQSKFHQSVLFTEPYVLVTPNDHRLSNRRSVRFAELDGEPLIARTHCENRQVLAKLLKEHGARLKVRYRTNQDDRALVLVASGLGVAFVPDHYETIGACKIALADKTPKRTVGLQWRRHHESDTVERFVNFAKTNPWGRNDIS